MNYFYILVGTLYAVILVAQVLAYSASTKKTKVEVAKVPNEPNLITPRKIY